MTPRYKLVAISVPCLLAIGGAAFAQGGANTTVNGAATTTTTTAAGAPAPAAPMPADNTTAATTTTTTTTAPAADTGTMPKTGGDPGAFVLFGGALSGGMLALKRRFAR